MIAVERMSPTTWMPPWCRHEHLARYRWAANYVAGNSILDAACGTGYGARVLLDAGAHRVDGFDIDSGAVDEARELNAELAEANFAVADATALPVEDASYDVYLSFETIEHLADDAAYLREAARILRPGGVFLCSTPNRVVTNPGKSITDRPLNPFHLREYAHDDLAPLLARFFPSVTFYGQSFYGRRYVRMLGAVGRRLPWVAARLHQVRKLLQMPLERPSWHEVEPCGDRRAPEILVAVCQTASCGA
jgi:SAM-dependent methyltransferase